MKEEPMLTYALSVGTGRMVCIDNVEGGLSCNCCCPKCKEPLIAKKGNGGRQSHFAHKSGSDCHGSYMTALHRMAEQIIQEEKSVMAPAYKDVYEQKLHFNSVASILSSDKCSALVSIDSLSISNAFPTQKSIICCFLLIACS